MSKFEQQEQWRVAKTAMREDLEKAVALTWRAVGLNIAYFGRLERIENAALETIYYFFEEVLR